MPWHLCYDRPIHVAGLGLPGTSWYMYDVESGAQIDMLEFHGCERRPSAILNTI